MIPDAFLTGSRVFGVPRDDSDVDMVVFLEEPAAAALTALADADTDTDESKPRSASEHGPASRSLRFGKLNLIVVTSRDWLEAWAAATAQCIARKPVTREQALPVFKGLFKDLPR